MDNSTVAAEKFERLIRARGLEIPAIFLLELLKPVAGLVRTSGITGSSQFHGGWRGMLELVQSPETIEKLIVSLETSGRDRCGE